jgi:hypothetical protein
MKSRLLGLAIAAGLLLTASGCKGETQAEKEASFNCPSFSARANGECESVQADEQAKHKEEVESELREAEDVIKKRRAEETASAVEGIEGGR